MKESRRARDPQLSAQIERQLHERLFAPQASLVAAIVTMASETVIGYLQTGQRWFVEWGVASIVVVIMRMMHESAYRRRRKQDGPVVAWRRWYVFGAGVNGLICGFGGAAALHETGSLAMMLFGVWVALVYGAAVRNALYPDAAKIFIAFAQVPCLVATVEEGVAYVPFLLFNALFFASAITVTRALYVQTVDFMQLDEEKATLVEAVQQSNADLAAANSRLAAMVMVDGLTGVLNRRAFDEALQAASRAAERDGSQLSVLMMDIDFFKKYNDRYGHQAGDECLRQVALTLRSALRRPTDMLARYGGEEFVALLPQTDEGGVAAVGEGARAAVEALGLMSDAAPGGVVTVSIGATTSLTAPGWSGTELVGVADRALYAAKAGGRNRVVVASAPRVANLGISTASP